jgi:repressor LexA
MDKRLSTLTAKQQRVLEFIRSYIQEREKSPSTSEIAEALGFSSYRSVTQYIESLEKKGLVQRDRYETRNIRLLENTAPREELIQLPVFASVGCGTLSVLTERVFDEYVTISNGLIRKASKENMYVIRAVGDSMKDAGVNDGDFVLVEKTQDVQTGDLVVTVVGENAVLKKLTKANNAYVLESVNKSKAYPPIILSTDFSIFGKLVDIIRIENNRDYEIVPLTQSYA